MLGGFAVLVEIGRQQRRRLRRVFHHAVGEHLDHAGAKKVRIDVAVLADLHKTRHGLIAVVARRSEQGVGISQIDRHSDPHGEPAGVVQHPPHLLFGWRHEHPPHLLFGRCHKGIHQRGDAIGRHPLQLGSCQCRLFLQRRRRNLLIHKDRGAVGKVAGRRALSVAGDLASRYVRRFSSHPKQRKAAAVDPDRMPVIAPERDRPFRLDAVQVLGRCREAVIVELRRLEPLVGTALILGEAVLDDRLQHIDRRFHAGKAAFGAVERADDGMDVSVDEPRQYQLAAEINDIGPASDQGRHIRVGPTATMVLPRKAIACLIERSLSAV